MARQQLRRAFFNASARLSMIRRDHAALKGARYACSMSSMEVHDLDQETPECRIDALLLAGTLLPYQSLVIAHRQGFMNCPFCFAPLQAA